MAREGWGRSSPIQSRSAFTPAPAPPQTLRLAQGRSLGRESVARKPPLSPRQRERGAAVVVRFCFEKPVRPVLTSCRSPLPRHSGHLFATPTRSPPLLGCARLSTCSSRIDPHKLWTTCYLQTIECGSFLTNPPRGLCRKGRTGISTAWPTPHPHRLWRTLRTATVLVVDGPQGYPSRVQGTASPASNR